jgi:hypothetical protein
MLEAETRYTEQTHYRDSTDLAAVSRQLAKVRAACQSWPSFQNSTWNSTTVHVRRRTKTSQMTARSAPCGHAARACRAESMFAYHGACNVTKHWKSTKSTCRTGPVRQRTRCRSVLSTTPLLSITTQPPATQNWGLKGVQPPRVVWCGVVWYLP